MDDSRAFVSSMKKGTLFDGEKLCWTEEAEEQKDAETTSEDVTFREMGKALNSISPNLKFTLERQSDFEDEWLPTLDFKIKRDTTNNRFTHSFYEKPMNTKWVVPFKFAMDPSSNRQILSNDLVRRLSRVDPRDVDTLAPGVINAYNKKLVFSGYPWEQRVRIVDGGIEAYMRKPRANGV